MECIQIPLILRAHRYTQGPKLRRGLTLERMPLLSSSNGSLASSHHQTTTATLFDQRTLQRGLGLALALRRRTNLRWESESEDGCR